MLSIKLNIIHNETADLITYAEEVLTASVEPVNYDDLYIMEQKMERIERMAGEIRETIQKTYDDLEIEDD